MKLSRERPSASVCLGFLLLRGRSGTPSSVSESVYSPSESEEGVGGVGLSSGAALTMNVGGQCLLWRMLLSLQTFILEPSRDDGPDPPCANLIELLCGN